MVVVSSTMGRPRVFHLDPENVTPCLGSALDSSAHSRRTVVVAEGVNVVVEFG